MASVSPTTGSFTGWALAILVMATRTAQRAIRFMGIKITRVTMRALGVFTVMLACSGQPAPTVTSVHPPAPPREVVIPAPAEIAPIVGAPCDPTHPCGGKLQCGGGPGGYCTKPCSE